MFRYFKDIASVQRFQEVIDGEYKKKGYVSTGKTFKGYLTPVRPEDIITNSAFGKEYNFTTVKNADILESDRLVINGEEYEVKAIVPYAGIKIKYKKLVLNKS